MNSEFDRIQKALNSRELIPKKGFRRDVAIYELVCYVNNITGCYISENLEPIRIFISRARTYIEDNGKDDVNSNYIELVSRYLDLMENYLDQHNVDN